MFLVIGTFYGVILREILLNGSLWGYLLGCFICYEIEVEFYCMQVCRMSLNMFWKWWVGIMSLFCLRRPGFITPCCCVSWNVLACWTVFLGGFVCGWIPMMPLLPWNSSTLSWILNCGFLEDFSGIGCHLDEIRFCSSNFLNLLFTFSSNLLIG